MTGDGTLSDRVFLKYMSGTLLSVLVVNCARSRHTCTHVYCTLHVHTAWCAWSPLFVRGSLGVNEHSYMYARRKKASNGAHLVTENSVSIGLCNAGLHTQN